MSPIIQPDTSEAQDMAPIEPGTYQADIMSVDYQIAKSSGNPMIVPKFAVTVEQGKKPRTRGAYLVITGEGAFGFDQLLRACHLDEIADQYKDPSIQPKPPFDTDVLVGQKVQVVIAEDIYKDQKRDKITGFLKA